MHPGCCRCCSDMWPMGYCDVQGLTVVVIVHKISHAKQVFF